MRLTVLGGGGFRVPLVYAALAAQPSLGIDSVVLHDVDEARLEVIQAVLRQQCGARQIAPTVSASTNLDEALSGASFVFAAVRVGGADGRVVDERVALDAGVLGQETIGPGGISYGLRTVPELVRVAEVIKVVAPAAWVINFTNPVGMVTEAMSAVLGDRVIGVCDSASGLTRRVADALGRPEQEMSFDYVGLNHLGWLRGAFADGRDLLPGLLNDDEALSRIDEGRIFGADLLRSLGMVPNEYLYYVYDRTKALAGMRAAGVSRAEQVADQQRKFYDAAAAAPHRALDLWREAQRERTASYMQDARAQNSGPLRPESDGGYEGVALGVLSAIAHNARTVQILNVRNRGAVGALDPEAVVEVPCVVDANGARPLAVGQVSDHCAGLMLQAKAVERDTIEAALAGDRRAALRALATHPVVGSVAAAQAMLVAYEAAFGLGHS